MFTDPGLLFWYCIGECPYDLMFGTLLIVARSDGFIKNLLVPMQ